MSDAAMNTKGFGIAGGIRFFFKNFKWSEHSTGLAFIVVFVLAAIVGWPVFLKPGNLLTILWQISYTGVIALGMTLIIISGGIDLSVGSMMAIVGGISLFLLNWLTVRISPTAAILICIVFCPLFGTVCGAFNGFLVTKCKIAPFIATLGTMSIFRSLIQQFSKAANIVSVNAGYQNFGGSYQSAMIYAVGGFVFFALIFHLLLHNTRLGRYICAVGANEQVARYSAINVTLIKFLPYVITGFSVGICALLWSSRMNTIQPTSDGMNYELNVIAAVVIGGTSMSGGKGTIIGTIMGAIILGMINSMLVLGGVSSFLQQAARGLVIIVAVLLQYNNNNR
jgi:ribose transport system permease protein